MRITHLGTATVLLEIGSVRLIVDPVFDPSGTTHQMAPLFASTKTYATPLAVADVGALDAILLSHDQHGDNLDPTGRTLLESVPRVLTTPCAKKRLGPSTDRILALAPFESTEIGDVKITATPCRHGPPLSLPFVGEVIGFLLEPPDRKRYWVTGDTVFYAGLLDVAKRFEVDLVIAHMGCAAWGPIRFTMNAREGVELAKAFPRARIVPVHYDGWTHFKESRGDVERAFAAAGLAERLTWLAPGEPAEL